MGLIKTLLDLIPLPKYQTFFTWIVEKKFNVLQHAIQVLREDDAVWFLNTLLQEVQRGCPGWTFYSEVVHGLDGALPPLSVALHSAISRGYLDAMQVLLEAGAPATSECLCEAVHAKNINAIITLLDLGASPVGVFSTSSFARHSQSPIFSRLYRDNFAQSTPYAEAMRPMFPEAIRVFDNNMIDLTRTPVPLTLVVAASEIGDVTSLKRFLRPHEVDDLEEECFRDDTARAYADALYLARKRSDINIVSMLLEVGAYTTDHETLTSAIHSRDIAMVHMVMERANGTCSVDHVIAAIKTEDRVFLHAMLECVNLSTITGGGEILKYIVELEDADLIRHLILNGLSTDSYNPYKSLVDYSPSCRTFAIQAQQEALDTPLTIAIRKRNTAIIRLLLDAGSQICGYICSSNAYVVSAIEAAAYAQDTGLIELFLAMGAEPYDSRAVMALAQLGDMALIEKLLAVGRHRFPKSDGRHLCLALVDAMRSNKKELFHLLARHADLNGRHRIEQNWCKTTETRRKANVLGVVLSPELLLSTEFLRLLLHAGSHPEVICMERYFYDSFKETKSVTRYTPLLNAVYVKSIAHIDVLLEHGANINRPATNTVKKTPLQLAADLGHIEVVAHLLRKGADANGPPAPIQGFTALQSASMRGFCPIVELLINHGADVNAPAARINGRTAFECATEWGRLDVMLLLVRNGADLLSIDGDKQFQRAITFAKKKGEDPAIHLAEDLQQKAAAATVEVESYGKIEFSF